MEGKTAHYKEEQNTDEKAYVKIEIKTNTDLSITTRDGAVYNLKYDKSDNALFVNNWWFTAVSYDPCKKEIYTESVYSAVAYDKNGKNAFLPLLYKTDLFPFVYPTFEQNIARFFKDTVTKGDSIYVTKHRITYCLE